MIRPATFADVMAVARDMRAADREEIFATRWSDDEGELARDCLAGWTRCCFVEGTPTAIIGAIPVRPGSWQVFMFATDQFKRCRISVTRFVLRVMIPILVEYGVHRAECQSIEGHAEAHAWLEYLGARREAVHSHFGRNGETFYTYVWTLADVRTQQAPRPQPGRA